MKLKPSPTYEKNIGILYYQTASEGVGGKIRCKFEDFVVREVRSTLLSRCKGKYVYYELAKKGIDTLLALMLVSKKLKVPLKDIGYAGLKDTHALTYQHISLPAKYGIKERVNIADNVVLKFLGLADKPLRRGMLEGNLFKVIIRDTFNSEVGERISKVLCEINELGGLYPYYGHQRFGTIRPNTHIVGKYIVNRMWKQAVLEIIGRPYPYEKREIAEARRFFEETENAEKTLKMFPPKYVYERILLRSLAKNPGNYLYALKSLPKFIVHFYVEAYQSFIFNILISKRIEQGIAPNIAAKSDIVVRGGEYSKVNFETKIDSSKEKILLPLVGYKTRIFDPMLSDILKEEEVETKDFIIKELGIFVEGGFRKSPMTINRLDYVIWDNNVYFSFFLEKGYYATVFLREIMKNENVF